MLQVYKSPSVQVEEGLSTDYLPYSTQPSLADLVAKVIGFTRRQFLVVLSVLPLALGLAAIYLFTTPPIYSADTRIIIDKERVKVFQQSILGEDPVDAIMMESQLEILKSENFALSIVKNLHLTQYPEFVAPKVSLIGFARKVISKLFTSRDNQSNTEFELTRSAVTRV